ncbi:kinase-like protein [Rhizophagus irregularis]|uniref:Kinase-like protein n=1 Tax=Rhizophagus irregularis TaxID=588596 RepID=A0A2I1HLB0_9GLOM|nr:kinase-like protein [Rhizophagus irregularis]
MEPVNTIDENSFDPTPRLKSSPIPIKFISFNKGDENCICCGEKYIQSLLSYEQKYCKKCLSSYINDTTDYNLYLDVLVDLECSDHEINKTKVPQSIQECCGDLKILSFKQILEDHSTPGGKYDKVYKSEKYCKLCGKSLLHRETYITKEFIFCSDCYLMFTERMESSLVKKKISIFYIPWWHTVYKCDVCYSTLIFTSDCQKYCSNCYIFYVGCRYCLTTNIIFGPTGQTQCKKCKRISFIIILCDNLAKFENTEFTNITWNYQKLRILWQISEGLEHIHKNKFIHRDFHSGNMLFDLNTSAGKNYQWKIGDLGLSQEINNESSNNEIYGIIPYIAPEIFKGSSFSKKADVYSLGMVMWELTTGCKPFDNVKHDHNLIYNILDGERPKITEDTPECYANLMKKFAEKRHSEAIYISRPLSALISKCLSTNSSSISIGNKKDSNYIYVSEEQELDIDIESSSSQNLSLKIQNTSTSFKKRNIEELNLETDDNSVGKRIKTS